ncbi:hypothetical protein HLN31_003029 [Shigella sonnei]|nr:hypothetical protein [Shigella sonnei]
MAVLRSVAAGAVKNPLIRGIVAADAADQIKVPSSLNTSRKPDVGVAV